MKIILPLTATLLLLAVTGPLFAGTASSSLSEESLIAAPPVENVSFGINYDNGKRQITDGTLESRIYSAYLGYDIVEWCTLYATLGNSQAKTNSREKLGAGKFRGSVGVSANLWHLDLDEPPIFAGRISLRPSLDYAQNSSASDSGTLKWMDITGALFLNYEKVMKDPKYNITEFYGFSLYAGPAFSTIDGTLANGGDFKAKKDVGLIAGADFFATKNLSLGVQIQTFDEMSFNGNVRYHF